LRGLYQAAIEGKIENSKGKSEERKALTAFSYF
jgi:hypothetical protein